MVGTPMLPVNRKLKSQKLFQLKDSTLSLVISSRPRPSGFYSGRNIGW